MNGGLGRARVTVRPRRLWSVRLSLVAVRWLLYAVALVGVAATARDAISPPTTRLVVRPAAPAFDASSQWFALSFARAYLTWSADPTTHEEALASFLGSTADPDAGLQPATGSSEQVRWLAIAAERTAPGGEHDYTIAAAVGAGSVRYLALAVVPVPGGGEVLARYPALVGAPAVASAGDLAEPSLATVSSPAVTSVIVRALRNYLDASGENLAADLAAGAAVAPVAYGLSLRRVLRLAVESPDVVLATVSAADQRGDLFTLAYEVGLTQLGDRWEITRIQS